MTFIKFFLLLFVYTFSINASATKIEVIINHDQVIEDNESEDEALNKAIQRSKDKALLQAGVIERHQSYFYTTVSEDNGKVDSRSFYQSYSELDGNIFSTEILKNNRRKKRGIWYLIVKVKFIIVKYRTINDPTFIADFNGIKKVYQDSSCINFKIDPNQDCYLTIFYLTDDETQIVYPIKESETSDDRLHNRVFNKGEIITIDWICTVLKGKKIEEGSLICIITKRYIPFYERKKKGEFSINTSRGDFFEWLSMTERDEKKLKEFPITIVTKE